MKLHIYHCNLVVIEDRMSSPSGGGKFGSNKPSGIHEYLTPHRESDIHFLPPNSKFNIPWVPNEESRPTWLTPDILAKLLEEFRSVDIFDPENSPVYVNWSALEDRLQLSRDQLQLLMGKADEMGLLRRLTIDYDHARWMRHSSIKGCLVVMVCVEQTDYENEGVVRLSCNEIINIRSSIIDVEDTLTKVFLVPNVHLTGKRCVGEDHVKNGKILNAMKVELETLGLEVELNSYGYAKNIILAICAHKLGYVFRSF